MKCHQLPQIHSLGCKFADVLQQNGAAFNSSCLCFLLRQLYFSEALGPVTHSGVAQLLDLRLHPSEVLLKVVVA